MASLTTKFLTTAGAIGLTAFIGAKDLGAAAGEIEAGYDAGRTGRNSMICDDAGLCKGNIFADAAAFVGKQVKGFEDARQVVLVDHNANRYKPYSVPGRQQ